MMLRRRLHVSGIAAFTLSLFAAGAAQALPSLQLGPAPGSVGWTYDYSTQTWVTSNGPVELLATANATMADGGNGGYAWDTTGAPKTAYLVVSAVPKQSVSGVDYFNITLSSPDAGTFSLVDSGIGIPPPSDPNDLAPHGIFSTYYEVYAFTFDGTLGTINNTQPGDSGTGMGYSELINVAINSLEPGVGGLHFDLFTLESGGTGLVEAFAPFSHDAEFLVPEPRAALLFAVGGVIAGVTLRRRRPSS